jgi:flagellar hook-associated protein 2
VGNEKNATTDGLKLLVQLTEDQLKEGRDGTITLAKGVAAKMNDLVSNLTATGQGLMDRRIKAYENQAKDLAERITDFDKRLAARRESLQKQFYAMEQALSLYSSMSEYLTNQVTSVNKNWNLGRNSS